MVPEEADVRLLAMWASLEGSERLQGIFQGYIDAACRTHWDKHDEEFWMAIAEQAVSAMEEYLAEMQEIAKRDEYEEIMRAQELMAAQELL